MARLAVVDAESSIIAAAGTAIGVGVTKAFDYLKVRRREASGDRRSASQEWGNLIDRLEKRLNSTESAASRAAQAAEDASARLIECERGHVACRTELILLRRGMNELRHAAGMDPLPEEGE
jgi:hypothetical protein